LLQQIRSFLLSFFSVAAANSLSFFLSSLLLLGCLITLQGKKETPHSLQILKSS
jgi:hypothetical protein